MGFWHWFNGKGKAKQAKRSSDKPLEPKIAAAFSKVKRDMKALRTDLAQANTKLAQQTDTISDHTKLLHKCTSRLDKLEDIAATAPEISSLPELATSRPETSTNRPAEAINRLVATRMNEATSPGKFDLANFSAQEKRIMGVFLAHREMALSYLDIATYLGKSANTIKNQIRQMNMKSSLLDKAVDADKKNRFRLKKHLKIEADLDAD